MIRFGEEHGFIDAGGIFKRDKFHGVTLFCKYRLTGDHPADGGDPFPHPGMKIPGFHIVQAFEDVVVALEGMDRMEEAQGVHLMSEHEFSGVEGREIGGIFDRGGER